MVEVVWAEVGRVEETMVVVVKTVGCGGSERVRRGGWVVVVIRERIT